MRSLLSHASEIRQRHPFFVFDKFEHFVMWTNSRPRIYIKWGLINKDIPIGGCRFEPAICFQRVFNFRGTRWNIDKCATVTYWSRLVNVYPETSFKSPSRATSVLHYSLRQYSQYTVIGRTALVTSQSKGSDSPLHKSREVSRIINYRH